MSNRKEEIIETAIKLFNEKGCFNTSTRHIADKLNISVGNLYYYFRNKEEILVAIYEECMALLSKHLYINDEIKELPFDFYSFIYTQMQIEEKYRFFRLEMNNIYTNYKSIKKVFEIGINKKNQEFINLYTHQIKYGYMKELDEKEMRFICSNTWIVGSQWEIYWLLNKHEDEKLRIFYGVLNLLYFIKPYLTKKGLEESNLLKSIEYLNKEIENA